MVNNQPKTQDTQQNESINREVDQKSATDAVTTATNGAVPPPESTAYDGTYYLSQNCDYLFDSPGRRCLFVLTEDIVLTDNSRKWGLIHYSTGAFDPINVTMRCDFDLNGHTIKSNGGTYTLSFYSCSLHVYDSVGTGHIESNVIFSFGSGLSSVLGGYVSVYAGIIENLKFCQAYYWDHDKIDYDLAINDYGVVNHVSFYDDFWCCGDLFDFYGGVCNISWFNKFNEVSIADYAIYDDDGTKIRSFARDFSTYNGQQYANIYLTEADYRLNESMNRIMKLIEHNNYQYVRLRMSESFAFRDNDEETWQFSNIKSLMVDLWCETIEFNSLIINAQELMIITNGGINCADNFACYSKTCLIKNNDEETGITIQAPQITLNCSEQFTSARENVYDGYNYLTAIQQILFQGGGFYDLSYCRFNTPEIVFDAMNSMVVCNTQEDKHFTINASKLIRFCTTSLSLNNDLNFTAPQITSNANQLDIYGSNIKSTGSAALTLANCTLYSGSLESPNQILLQGNQTKIVDGTVTAPTITCNATTTEISAGVLRGSNAMTFGGNTTITGGTVTSDRQITFQGNQTKIAGGTVTAPTITCNATTTEISAGVLRGSNAITLGGNTTIKGGTVTCEQQIVLQGNQITTSGGRIMAHKVKYAATAINFRGGNVNFTEAEGNMVATINSYLVATYDTQGRLLTLGDNVTGYLGGNTQYYYPTLINGYKYVEIYVNGNTNMPEVAQFCLNNNFYYVKLVINESFLCPNHDETWGMDGARFKGVILDLHGHNIECKSLTIQANQIRVEGPGQIQCTAKLEFDTASFIMIGDDNITLQAHCVAFTNCQGVTLPYALTDYAANQNHNIKIKCAELDYNGSKFTWY